MTTDPFRPLGRGVSSSKKNGDWTPIVPVPSQAPPPPGQHPTLGRPTETYAYRSETGEINGYVWRFEHSGGKEFRPLTYCLHPGGVLRDWRWTTWQKPRPLFNLDKLRQRRGAPVLVTEGEKACRAVERLAPGYVCITSPGGSKAAGQADWSQLNGREIVIWPDADDPGRQYGAAVAKHCGAMGAARVSIIEPPSGVVEGWDAADAVAAGYDEDQILRLIRSASAPRTGVRRSSVEESDDGEGGRRRGRPAQRDQLLVYINNVEVWHDDADRAYATFPVGSHRENAPIRSSRFRHWLTLQYLDEHETAPAKNAMDGCLNAAEARAVAQGPRYTAFIRMAEHQGRLYLDLCDDGWRAIECTKNGWTIVDRVPVKFVRREGMLPLPKPEQVTEQCSGIEELRSFFGNLSQAHFALVVAWLMSCLRDTGVYPVLMVHGESGSGKTVLTKLLMDLIDPRAEKALSIPKDDRALIVFAKQTYLIGFENISVIPAWFSDALCRLASGDSFVAVKLYTDDELAVHKAKRPIVLNGIPRLAEREDLASRTFAVSLPPMTADRVTEPDLLERWRLAKPRILAGLLDGVCSALRNIESVRLPEEPRLIGALKWATAAEANFGFDDGETFNAYRESARETIQAAFEADIVAIVLASFIRNSTTKCWEGSPTQLFGEINAHASEVQRKMKSWPASPAGLTNRIERAAPVLRSQGVVVERRHAHAARLITIALIDPEPSPRSP
jgi:putative DNA primase/helicase